MQSKRPKIDFHFEQKPHILIVQTQFYPEITSALKEGALSVINEAGATHEVIDVPGALEIAAAIIYAVKSLDFDAVRRRYDGYVALGCVLKGETLHDEIVGHVSATSLQEIAMRYALAIGNGILTCDTLDQAIERSRMDKMDRGGAAAEACLKMIEIKHHFHLSPKRRWVAR